jgi:uncharacterized protein (TIGR03435 family)
MRSLSELMLVIDGSLALSTIVKVTITTASALICTRLARRSRAAVRHVVLGAGFAVLLVLPIASIVVPPVHIAVPTEERDNNLPSVFEPAIDVPVTEPFNEIVAVTPATTSLLSKLSLSALFVAGWIGGLVVSLLPVVIGLWQMRSLRRAAQPWHELRSLVDRLAIEMGICRQVEVLMNETVPGPMTCGVMHPTIMLPLDAQNWAEDDLTRAIVHELEHVRRGDWATRSLARALCAFYWFHPLVWIAWKQFALEAERACDDAVLLNSDPTDYAEQLIVLAQRLSTIPNLPPLRMASRHDLAARVKALLDIGQHRGRAGLIWLALTFAATVLVVSVISPLVLVSTERKESASQLASPTNLSFEVASIKQNNSGAEQSSMLPAIGGRFTATNVSLSQLVRVAFEVQDFQIDKNPGWFDTAKYDIEAKADANVSAEQVRTMLRSLLTDRFKLSSHESTKDTTVLVLVGAKNGPKLTAHKGDCKVPPEGPCGTFRAGPGRIDGDQVSMDQLVTRLSRSLGRTVVNQTRLGGTFDLSLEWKPDTDDSMNLGTASIFSAIQEQLGLRLESRKAPVATLVIDHVERPTENDAVADHLEADVDPANIRSARPLQVPSSKLIVSQVGQQTSVPMQSAQSPPTNPLAPSLAVEGASVKPSQTGGRGSSLDTDPKSGFRGLISASAGAQTKDATKPGTMSREETIVRTTYAKLVYAAQVGEIERILTEHRDPTTIDRAEFARRLRSVEVTFQLADMKVGNVEEFSNKKMSEVTTDPSGDVLSASAGSFSYGYDGVEGRSAVAALHWIQGRQSLIDDWDTPFGEVLRMAHNAGNLASLYARCASYSATVSFQGKSRSYRAAFLFGNGPDGKEDIMMLDHIVNGTSYFVSNSAYPGSLLLEERNVGVIAEWLRANQVSAPGGRHEVACDLDKLKCGVASGDLDRNKPK